jgi:LacI family transcriptional regulator
MIKLIDVARKARVSEATASLALNRKPGVSADTRERVLKAAKALGYSPNTLARGLATRKTHSLGLVVTDIENPFFGSLTRHIDEFILEAGYNLILSVSNDELELEARIIQDFIGKRVDGVIVVPTLLPRRDFAPFANLSKHNIPCVFSTSYYPGVPCECVMTDLEEGACALTRHLLKLGHRDILLLVSNNREVVPSRLRIQGCRRAFEELGLALDRRRVVECERTDFDCGYATTLRIVKKGKPDTVMAINDIMALGAKRAIKELGYAIPEEISVAGYDDVIFSSIPEIPLTTVRQNIRQIARQTVELLLRQVRGRASAGTVHWVRPNLVLRKSTSVCLERSYHEAVRN